MADNTGDDLVIIANVATWEAAVQVKVDEIAYVRGFAEVTVYAFSIIHNGTTLMKWRQWLRRVAYPDVRATDEDSPGLDVLVKAVPGGFFVTREAEKPDLERMNLAADLLLATFLDPNPIRGDIVFEVGYTLKLEDRVKKAERCLFEADVPRPSVVVIINFMEQGAQKDYGDMEVQLELVWPQDKAKNASNTQHITFSMEEVVGTIEVNNQAIHMQKNLNDVEDKLTRNMLEDVPALQIL